MAFPVSGKAVSQTSSKPILTFFRIANFMIGKLQIKNFVVVIGVSLSLLLLSLSGYAQNGTVTSTATDGGSGLLMPGVAVKITNNSEATANASGDYSIKAGSASKLVSRLWAIPIRNCAGKIVPG